MLPEQKEQYASMLRRSENAYAVITLALIVVVRWVLGHIRITFIQFLRADYLQKEILFTYASLATNQSVAIR